MPFLFYGRKRQCFSRRRFAAGGHRFRKNVNISGDAKGSPIPENLCEILKIVCKSIINE